MMLDATVKYFAEHLCLIDFKISFLHDCSYLGKNSGRRFVVLVTYDISILFIEDNNMAVWRSKESPNGLTLFNVRNAAVKNSAVYNSFVFPLTSSSLNVFCTL